MKKDIKKEAVLFTVIFGTLCACNLNDIDDKALFADYFSYRLSVIADYESQWNDDNQHDICTQEWMYFLENCDYLESLTGCHFHYLDSEPPFYENHELFMKDSTYLNDWLNDNGGHWTIRKADAYVYKKRKGHTVYY